MLEESRNPRNIPLRSTSASKGKVNEAPKLAYGLTEIGNGVNESRAVLLSWVFSVPSSGFGKVK